MCCLFLFLLSGLLPSGCERHFSLFSLSNFYYIHVFKLYNSIMLYLYSCRRSEEEVIIQDGHTKAVEKMDLGFNGIYMELAAKKKKKSRVILDGSIRGRARPGRMLAIMGPSGGKLTVISLFDQLLSFSVNTNQICIGQDTSSTRKTFP